MHRHRAGGGGGGGGGGGPGAPPGGGGGGGPASVRGDTPRASPPIVSSWDVDLARGCDARRRRRGCWGRVLDLDAGGGAGDNIWRQNRWDITTGGSLRFTFFIVVEIDILF